MNDLYEVGIIKNGIPSLRIAFVKPEELKAINPLLLSGFIQVLNDFVDSTFEDIPKRLEMNKFIAHFCPVEAPQGNETLILYSFTSPTYGKQSLEPVLEKIKENLQAEMGKNGKNEKSELFEKMEAIILRECQSLVKTSKYSDKLKYF